MGTYDCEAGFAADPVTSKIKRGKKTEKSGWRKITVLRVVKVDGFAHRCDLLKCASIEKSSVAVTESLGQK